jgi:hypothetical protein
MKDQQPNPCDLTNAAVQKRDLELIDSSLDELNSEALDVLEYQDIEECLTVPPRKP